MTANLQGANFGECIQTVGGTKRKRAMKMGANFRIVPLMRGLLGAAVGALVGYFAFEWILGQRFYAMILPGLLWAWDLVRLRVHARPATEF